MKRSNLYLHVYGFILICAGSLESSSDTNCTISGSEPPRFGDKCQYDCHCLNTSEQCDTITGNCVKGCDFEWVGHGCQFRNIAYGKRVRQSNGRMSAFANDDNLSTCSFASVKNKSAPWWNVWIPKFTTFKKIEFVTTKSHLNTFSNFELTVYNTTETKFKRKGSVKTGTICYQHNNTIPQDTKIQVTCDGSPFGNLLRLQLHGQSEQLVLCDFKIYEDCKNGFYGNGCEKCSENCDSKDQKTCNAIDGDCLHGCKLGWKGNRCETAECDPGYFGRHCKQRCNRTCSRSGSPVCNNVNGTCINGCIEGYIGSYCEFDSIGTRITRNNDVFNNDELIVKLKLILIILGSISIVISLYATVITVLFKRRSAQNKEMELTGKVSNQSNFANETFESAPETKAANDLTSDMKEEEESDFYVNLSSYTTNETSNDVV